MKTRMFFLVGIGVLSLILSCSFQEPILPTWMIPVNIPLSEKTFIIGKEIINDSTIVAQGADSLIYLSFDGEVSPTVIDREHFSMGPVDSVFEFSLDTLRLQHLDTMRTEIVSLRELFPNLSFLIGQTVTIPETSLVPPAFKLQSDEFKKIKLVNGNVRLRLINNLPFVLGPNSTTPQGFEITLFNDSLNQQIGQIQIQDPIPSGGSGTGRDFIGDGNTWIYSKLRLDYVIPIAQATTFTVTDSLLDAAGFYIELALEDLEASEAIAKFKKQEFTRQFASAFHTENRLREGVIDRGSVVLSIVNNLPLTNKIFYKFPNIQTPSEQIFVDSLEIPAFSNVQHTIVLDGFRVRGTGTEGSYIKQFSVEITARTSGTNEFVHLRSDDSFSFRVYSDSLFFQYFEGHVAHNTIQIEPFQQDNLIDYDDLNSGIKLQDADLYLTVFSEVFIDSLYADLTITGYRKDSNGLITDSAQIIIQGQRINPGYPEQAATTLIAWSGQEVANFLNILPTAVKVSGEIQIGGNAAIHQGSRIWGEYSFSTPLKLEIRNAQPIRSEVSILKENDIDQDFRDSADEDFKEARLILFLTNHTPLGGEIRVIVSTDSLHGDIYDSTYFNSELEFMKKITVIPGETDPQTGFVNRASQEQIELALTRDEVRLFKKQLIRIGYELRMADTAGPVALRSNDYIKVSGIARITLIIQDKNK